MNIQKFLILTALLAISAPKKNTPSDKHNIESSQDDVKPSKDASIIAWAKTHGVPKANRIIDFNMQDSGNYQYIGICKHSENESFAIYKTNNADEVAVQATM